MTKTFRDNCDKNIVRQTSCELLFPEVQLQIKRYLFVLFVHPCMHHKYGVISESHACKDCVLPIILDAELYTTCPGERMLVVMTHQVQCNIPTFEALLRKICTCFSKDAGDLITNGCLLWHSQIFYIRPQGFFRVSLWWPQRNFKRPLGGIWETVLHWCDLRSLYFERPLEEFERPFWFLKTP